MELYFGTVTRGAPVRASGELVRLDWPTKRVIARVPLVPTEPSLDHDPNPRGNSRGCRGIVLSQDQVIAANYHTLKCFDRQLNHQRDITHGLFAGLHELSPVRDGRVWVTSTALDAVLEVDLEQGRVMRDLWPREILPLQEALGLEPFELDKTADNRVRFLDDTKRQHPSHLHLNAVCPVDDSLYALFNRFAAIVELTRGRVVVRDPELRGGHNLVCLPDGLLAVNATNGPAVRVYDPADGRLVRSMDLARLPWVARLAGRVRWRHKWGKLLHRLRLAEQPTAKPLFLRGLAVDHDSLFVGLSPASILELNLADGSLRDAFRFSEKVQVTIHGLALASS